MSVAVTIPVGVARTVVASAWYAQQTADGVPDTGPAAMYRRASKGGWQRKIVLNTSDEAKGLLAPLTLIEAEQGDKTLPSMRALADELRHWHDQLAEYEQIEAQQEAAKAQKREADMRRYRTASRERTMSVPIEAGRRTGLFEIAEDYGLNFKDPQIRAALTAAFHHGAQQFHQAANELLYGHPREDDVESLGKLTERDKELFAKARAAAKPEEA